MLRILTALLLMLVVLPAAAYIGPGAGIGFLGSLWAWLLGLVVVLLAVALWPLRWLWRRMRKRQSRASLPPAD